MEKYQHLRIWIFTLDAGSFTVLLASIWKFLETIKNVYGIICINHHHYCYCQHISAFLIKQLESNNHILKPINKMELVTFLQKMSSNAKRKH